MCLTNYDVICISETWLLDGIMDSELFDGRYLVFRRDRDYVRLGQTLGGGVLLAVRHDLAVVCMPEWNSSAEDIWVTLLIKRKRPATTYKMHICTMYLCEEEGGNSYKEQLSNFCDNLTKIVCSHPLDKFVVVGDFNFGKDVQWLRSNGEAVMLPVNYTAGYLSDFFDLIDTCNLSQFNGEYNHNHRVLDLVFSNGILNVKSCNTPLVPEDSHHKSLDICAEFVEIHELKQMSQSKYNYNRGDYSAISIELNKIDWSQCLSVGSLDDAVAYLYNKLYELRDHHIPRKIIKSNSYPPWYNSSLIKALKEKSKYHSKYKTYGNLSDYQSFSTLRKRVYDLEKDCFEKYIQHIESSIVENPKAFWTFVKTKRNISTFPSVMSYKSVRADTGEDISNLFAEYFHSTFLVTGRSVDCSVNMNSVNGLCNISDIQVDPTKVCELLKSLDLTKSGGPDLIPPLLIVKCAESLTVPLCLLYKRSLSEGVVPKLWKSAFITPVLKSGDRCIAENYRPISKLCLFAKVLERLVYVEVYSSIQNSFSDDQHGFLRQRSTSSNLIVANDFITDGMGKGAQVDVVYTDYKKCFDRIDHRILLSKLQAAGIHGNLYRWFASYIDNRNQAVVLRGYLSQWTNIPSGVPQGSILGPLLFIIFIMDINKCFRYSKSLLFADDMKILKVISSSSDVRDLQEDLLRFEQYCIMNKLDLNVTKCFCMTFSRKNNQIESNYTLNNHNLTRVNSIKDLGVIHDSKSIFKDHIDHIASKASRALGFVVRMSNDLKSLKTIKVLYCAFVRSHLEYASQVWNPQYNVYITRLENIQKRFLRFLDYKTGQQSLDYEHRCKRYHFLPLQIRREVNDLCFLSKLANGGIDCPELLSRIGLRTNLLALRHRPLLHIPFAHTNYRQNTFMIRGCRTYNRYSTEYDFDLFETSTATIRRTINLDYFSRY